MKMQSKDMKADSLLMLIKTLKEDSGKVNKLNGLAEYFMRKSEADQMQKYALQANELSKRINYKKGLATSIYYFGIFSEMKGDFSNALKEYFKSLKIREEIGNKEGIANCHSCIGIVYTYQGKVKNALEQYFIALRIYQDAKNQQSIGTSYLNIGTIYYGQGDLPKALEYYFNSLRVFEKIGNMQGIAGSRMNIANIYDDQKEPEKALEEYTRALGLFKKMQDKYNEGIVYNNIAGIYALKGDYQKALATNFKSLEIRKQGVDKYGIAISLNNIGDIYNKLGNYKEAQNCLTRAYQIRDSIGDKEGIATTYLSIGSIKTNLGFKETNPSNRQKRFNEAKKNVNDALLISTEIGKKERIRDSYLQLSILDSASGQWQSAYSNYKRFMNYRDSLVNEENTRKSVEAQMNYEFDKKEEKAKADQLKKDVLTQEERQKQVIIRNSFIGGFALMLLLALLIFRNYKQKQKANEQLEEKNILIEKQKHLVEEKHKEITDSINYAERIQRSFLATQQHLNENLDEYFILFKPKDVVSGDFFFSATLSNGNFALVTADSTGHGVPGAIMSLLNITSLEKAIETHSSPADILNATRKIIIERLKKDGSSEGGKDGMDCSLCVYDKKQLKLYVASAYNPVWVVRNKEVLEIKPDKMPLGKSDRQDVPFTHQEIDLQKGDVVYTLTDGFPDQFGGPRGKKFMIKNLRELLLANSHLPMLEQSQRLDETFKNWVGNLEQVDDVTVIGVQI